MDPYADLYSIVSTYFVNHYYNVIYSVAKSAATAHNAPITDTYIELVRQFINHVRRDRETRHSMVVDLGEYYNRMTGLGGGHDFEDKLLEAFIPEKYLRVMSESQKDMNTVAIVTEIAQSMGVKIIKSNIITGIIDSRNDSKYIRDLQQYGQVNMRFLRDDMHAKYMTESISNKPRDRNNEKMYQYVEKILAEKKQAEETCNLLRNKLRESLRIIHELAEQRNQVVEIVKSSPAASPLISAGTGLLPDPFRSEITASPPSLLSPSHLTSNHPINPDRPTSDQPASPVIDRPIAPNHPTSVHPVSDYSGGAGAAAPMPTNWEDEFMFDEND